MIIDDLTISLLMLFVIRIFASLIFFQLFIKYRKSIYLLLLFTWLIYASGPIPDLLNFNADRTVLNPYSAYAAALSTALLMVSVAAYIKTYKKKVVITVVLAVAIIFGIIFFLFPDKIGLAVTAVQALFLLLMLFITVFNRSIIRDRRSSLSYLWLCVTLFFGILHAGGFSLFFRESPLSLRFIGTAIINLSLLLFFIYLDWEQTQRHYENALSERGILLQEIHHRVKNNLMIISSILHIQAETVADENKEIIKSIENRINTMAIVHEQLYRSRNFKDIDLGSYLFELIGSIDESLNFTDNPVKFNKTDIPIVVSINILVPTGMLVNEIVTNSFKHAFKGVESPELTVSMCVQESGGLLLIISDNGIGLDITENEKNNTTGFIIIDALKVQLNASIDIRVGSGTEYRISIPGVFNTGKSILKKK